MDKILTVTDVAGILKVKPITVREMFREKRLRAFKVGKAWRTTEPMLEEDIAAIARGEAPDVLPQPGAKTTAAEPAPAKKTAKRAKKTAAPKKAPELESSEVDDTQQLLF